MGKQVNGTVQAVGTVVRDFYETHPFPGFDPSHFPTREHFRNRANWFLRQLDRELPTGIRLADVGCGTGRVAAYLSMRNRHTVGVDFCRASLGQASALKEQLGLDGVTYLRGNLFQLPLSPGSFDVVCCLGVLHSTADPRAGFRGLVRLLRPGGLILVGLYNTYGRLTLRIRQRLVAGQGMPEDHRVIRRRLAGQLPEAAEETDRRKLRSWYADQFLHPHELTISLEQVGRWFRENGIEPLGCSPDPRLFARFRPARRWLDRSRVRGWTLSGLRPLLVQLRWILTLRGAGGYFVQAGVLPETGEAMR